MVVFHKRQSDLEWGVACFRPVHLSNGNAQVEPSKRDGFIIQSKWWFSIQFSGFRMDKHLQTMGTNGAKACKSEDGWKKRTHTFGNIDPTTHWETGKPRISVQSVSVDLTQNRMHHADAYPIF